MAVGERKKLELHLNDSSKVQWMADAYAKGDLDGSDVPVGPISTLVPLRYHTHIPREVLKSLVCENDKKTSEIRGKIGVADIPVITKAYTENVYEHILSNLTEIGRDAVEDIHPWIINVLVDWANFDNVICSSPLQGSVGKKGTEIMPFKSESQSQAKCGDDPQPVLNTSKTAKYPDSLSDKESQSLLPNSPENIQSSSKVWKPSEVRTLIHLRASYESKFNKPFCKKKVIWQEISEKINKLGSQFSAAQVEQKWKNLTKSFRDTVDHNSRSGNERKECPFFQELEEAYGYKANVKPIFTMGSLKSNCKEVLTSDNNNNNESSNVHMVSDDSNSSDEQDDSRKRRANEGDSFVDTHSKKGKKKESQNELMIKLIENFQNESKQEQQELLTELKQQHEQKMRKEDQKIKLMEQMIEVMKK